MLSRRFSASFDSYYWTKVDQVDEKHLIISEKKPSPRIDVRSLSVRCITGVCYLERNLCRLTNWAGSRTGNLHTLALRRNTFWADREINHGLRFRKWKWIVSSIVHTANSCVHQKRRLLSSWSLSAKVTFKMLAGQRMREFIYQSYHWLTSSAVNYIIACNATIDFDSGTQATGFQLSWL